MRQAVAIASAAVTGILAGATADRLIVQLPAFKRTGMHAWGDFSRKADLSPNGALFYPLAGIGSAALSIATAKRRAHLLLSLPQRSRRSVSP